MRILNLKCNTSLLAYKKFRHIKQLAFTICLPRS